MSRRYRVRIEYCKHDVTPRVYVEEPRLAKRDGEPIPHTYEGKRPCLWLPKAGEWHPDLWIAETVVPWTSLWLCFYELWHATGEWLGDGEHPDG